jgi:hypothetical protein
MWEITHIDNCYYFDFTCNSMDFTMYLLEKFKQSLITLFIWCLNFTSNNYYNIASKT